jgi:hypothetical protein
MSAAKNKAKKRVSAAKQRGKKTLTATDAVSDTASPPPLLELHVCKGLNACQGHGKDGSGDMAGTGSCATAAHSCHGNNDCRGQGGCGYLGNDVEQARPGEQACKWHGSCASPINQGRVNTKGTNKGKSVWKLARTLFENRMNEAGIPFGPSPGEGVPDDLMPDYEDSWLNGGCPPQTQEAKARPLKQRRIRHGHR